MSVLTYVYNGKHRAPNCSLSNTGDRTVAAKVTPEYDAGTTGRPTDFRRSRDCAEAIDRHAEALVRQSRAFAYERPRCLRHRRSTVAHWRTIAPKSILHDSCCAVHRDSGGGAGMKRTTLTTLATAWSAYDCAGTAAMSFGSARFAIASGTNGARTKRSAARFVSRSSQAANTFPIAVERQLGAVDRRVRHVLQAAAVEVLENRGIAMHVGQRQMNREACRPAAVAQ